MTEITISGNSFAVYTPKQDYLTPKDHSDMDELAKQTGQQVALDGSALEHVTSSDIRQLKKRSRPIVNPSPNLEHKLEIYNDKGAAVDYYNISGQKFDDVA